MDPCPSWCRIHTAARCRSTPVVVGWAAGRFQVACQLEAWAGRETALALLLPDRALLLPRPAAVELGAAWQGLCETAGWSM